MGKKARAQTKLRRLMQKRARKAAQRALYESYRNTGQNKKSKRFRSGNKKKSNLPKTREWALVPIVVMGVLLLRSRRVHTGPKCGNVGCKKCSEVWARRKVGLHQ